jgi:hypothetical protein
MKLYTPLHRRDGAVHKTKAEKFTNSLVNFCYLYVGIIISFIRYDSVK